MIEDLSLLPDHTILGKLEEMTLDEIVNDPVLSDRLTVLTQENYAKMLYVMKRKHREDMEMRIALATDA